MGLHHFFASPNDVDKETVTLVGDEARHASRVLRVRPGERITIADGTGRLYVCVVTATGDVVEADIERVREVPTLRPAITIHQALMKGDRMDDMVDRSVELGVMRIAPFAAEHSVVRWDADKRDKAVERWRAIALAAAKQSRSPWRTCVEPVGERIPQRADLVLHEEASVHLRDALPEDPPSTLEVVVGPEGGLSLSEIDACDALAVSLGERILRTDVAGPTCAALIAYTYGSLG